MQQGVTKEERVTDLQCYEPCDRRVPDGSLSVHVLRGCSVGDQHVPTAGHDLGEDLIQHHILVHSAKIGGWGRGVGVGWAIVLTCRLVRECVVRKCLWICPRAPQIHQNETCITNRFGDAAQPKQKEDWVLAGFQYYRDSAAVCRFLRNI